MMTSLPLLQQRIFQRCQFYGFCKKYFYLDIQIRVTKSPFINFTISGISDYAEVVIE